MEDTERNNSMLSDRNTENQKLGSEEILALKQAGKVGRERDVRSPQKLLSLDEERQPVNFT